MYPQVKLPWWYGGPDDGFKNSPNYKIDNSLTLTQKKSKNKIQNYIFLSPFRPAVKASSVKIHDVVLS